MSHFPSPTTYGTLWNCYFFPVINPGPQPLDQNPVFCSLCSNKINCGIQQDMAPTCSDENCNAWCHQACNGLSISQTCHAKNSGRCITWKFHEHGTGIAKIVIPPAPVYELPNRPSAIGKSCFVCRNPICTRYVDLVYCFRNPSCDNVCHIAVMCSRFTNPRGTSRTRSFHLCLALSSPLFTISNCPSIITSSHHNSPPRPTTSSLKSLLNQVLSLADTKSSKQNCAKCSAALGSNSAPVKQWMIQGIPPEMEHWPESFDSW